MTVKRQPGNRDAFGLCLLCRRTFQITCLPCAKVHQPVNRFAAWASLPHSADACDACLYQIGTHLAGGKVKQA